MYWGSAYLVLFTSSYSVLFISSYFVLFMSCFSVLFMSAYLVLFMRCYSVLFMSSYLVLFMSSTSVLFMISYLVLFTSSYWVLFMSTYLVLFMSAYLVLFVSAYLVLFKSSFWVIEEFSCLELMQGANQQWRHATFFSLWYISFLPYCQMFSIHKSCGKMFVKSCDIFSSQFISKYIYVYYTCDAVLFRCFYTTVFRDCKCRVQG